jgi:hypothetical protein
MTNKSQSDSKSTNIWDYKPSWCQPWSIILAGLTIVAVSWLAIHTIWLTFGVSMLIVAWWVYFLIIYPKAFAEYLTSQQSDNEKWQ